MLHFMSLNVNSQVQTPIAEESKVTFKIKNFGFNVNGSFAGPTGRIVFDPSALKDAAMDVTIDANSIDTDNNSRDNHLRKQEYFDVANYPRIRFVSTRVAASSKPGTLIVFGRLTIKKTTKDVQIPFSFIKNKTGYTYKGELKLNRRDYEVGGNSTISDNLTISIDVTTRNK